MSLRVKFEPRDIWVGAFWDRRPDGFHLYVCPIPLLVIHWHRPRCICQDTMYADREYATWTCPIHGPMQHIPEAHPWSGIERP